MLKTVQRIWNILQRLSNVDNAHIFSFGLVLIVIPALAQVPHYYCTAANSSYFQQLKNLIGSIHHYNYDHLAEIAVFDLGLTDGQRQELRAISKLKLYEVERTHSNIIKPCNTRGWGKPVPGWYAWKMVVLKQALDLFSYALYLDAGTTVCRTLDDLFKYIDDYGYFVCTVGDDRYNGKVMHPIRWGTTRRVIDMFNLSLSSNNWIIDQEFVMGGIIGISRTVLQSYVMPLYELTWNLKNFADDGSAPGGFGCGRHDQPLLSIMAYQKNMKIHQQDPTQTKPIELKLNDHIIPLFITWDAQYVDARTHLFSSRNHMPNYKKYVRAIRYCIHSARSTRSGRNP